MFYLLVALLIAFGRGGQHLLLLAAVVAVPMFGFLIEPRQMAGRVLTNPILWEFALGIMACCLYDRCCIRRVRAPLAWCAGVFLAVGIYGLWAWPDRIMAIGLGTVMGDTSVARALFWGVPVFTFFVAFIGFWKTGNGPVGRTLKLLGDASYSIYLSHLFVIMATAQMLKFVTLGPDLIVTLTLVVSAAVGIASYRLLEKPLLAAGQQSIRRWSLKHVHPTLDYRRRPRAS